MDRLKNHIDTLLDEQEKKRPTEQTGKSWWSLTKTCSNCYWSRKKIPPFLGYRLLGIVDYSEVFIFFFALIFLEIHVVTGYGFFSLKSQFLNLILNWYLIAIGD